jgi:hypothetical protein
VQEERQQHSAVMAAIEAIGPYVLGLSADDVRRIEDGARGETEAVRRAAVDAVGRSDDGMPAVMRNFLRR